MVGPVPIGLPVGAWVVLGLVVVVGGGVGHGVAGVGHSQIIMGGGGLCLFLMLCDIHPGLGTAKALIDTITTKKVMVDKFIFINDCAKPILISLQVSQLCYCDKLAYPLIYE